MKQKTRYNIRLAIKKEVEVKSSSNIQEFYEMAKVTSGRDGFGVHSQTYYQKVFDLFGTNGNCALLTAYYDSLPLASLLVIARGEMAYYMYGASSDCERNRMPAYLIQWEAMRWAKQKGCRYYDLWGIPDLDEDELEGSFQHKDSHEGLWGVYRFKRGFGGETWRSIGAWDRVYMKKLYSLYQLVTRWRGTQGD
jgi:lipid II:glycine glycyltransferase (peptidoglycan interpeptide bridge formation enzyme)